MPKLTLLLVNTLTFLCALFFYYVYATGSNSQSSVGEVCEQYSTLITPAGYAFGIWGLIYLMLLGFLVNHGLEYFQRFKEESLSQAGVWFALSNVFNGLWYGPVNKSDSLFWLFSCSCFV